MTSEGVEVRSEVLDLMKKKDEIESEIKELGAILKQNGVDMNDPLVDSEGFPRANIDVYQVRLARNKIICLQNDYKAIMKKIEDGLGKYYSSTQSTACSSPTSCSAASDYSDWEPFAKVSNVTTNSPAEESGLHNNDLILEFGSVNASNFKDVTTIAEVVRHSENIEILIKVRRDQRMIPLKLRPRKWAGKGMLGCLITGLESLDR